MKTIKFRPYLLPCPLSIVTSGVYCNSCGNLYGTLFVLYYSLELAQTLQEEERRAAEEAQRQQAMHQQQMAGRNGNQPPAQAAGAQRRQNRAGPAEPRDREEKKSDVSLEI